MVEAPVTRGGKIRDLVLIGTGHAHIHIFPAFAADPPPNTHVTVIADTPIATYSGMVPGLVAGEYRREQLEIDARPLATMIDARLIVAKVTQIDAANKFITLDNGQCVPYDIASFNVGSTVAGIDTPGVREHALPTRPIGLLVRGIDNLVERARHHKGPDPFHVIVVGAGAGGVEIAFTLEDRLSRETDRPILVTLLDGGPRILPGLPDALARRISRLCNGRHIEVRCNTPVTEVDAEHVTLESREVVSCEALIWVTGAISHSQFRDSDLATDDRGFLLIRSTLQAKDHDDVFATGDCATFIDYPQTPKAGVYAVRQGPYIAHNLRAALTGQPLKPYVPQGDFLLLMNLGKGYALGTKWGLRFGGKWVRRWKDHLDIKFMRRFQMPWNEAEE